ncbi:lysylphosphatidylglycerol synthase transmembrane domain-containing protein [Marinobacter bohaiensis]|uniref:lysylphosphatidylglycerol synthase transmembrane domain-containing protein n=1 Tax=Marinobacter bohaiensis TaxID=2201898 RepID=UPI0013A6C491|nr:lysylphosphatidylglycerol synthase transmembrane domain-containing protein [Marinobacter bohaiensis]
MRGWIGQAFASPWARWLWTLLVLIGALWVFGRSDWQVSLSQLTPAALAGALALTLVQVLVSAWRWQLTARRLGLPLDYRAAVREYYRATWINQVLPGGVLGDANRALRHGSAHGDHAQAAHAVMIERFSGQLVLILAALLAWRWMPIGQLGLSPSAVSLPGSVQAVIVGAGLALLLGLAWLARRSLRAHSLSFWRSLKAGLLVPDMLAWQLAGSTLVLASYVGVFVILAQALGLSMPPTEVVPCALILLLAMTLPVTVAGWGVREGVAGVLWLSLGYPAGEGVALGLAYGLVFLVSSLPGLVFMIPQLRPAT